MATRKVCYIWDENLIEQCNNLPAVIGRATMVHNLIEAYGLINKVKVVRSSPVSYGDLKEFHSEIYLDHLKTFSQVDEDYMPNDCDEEFGLGYDCPPVSHMYHLVTTLAGGSVTAARCLLLGLADVAINWCGGWHHAQRFGAEGFCYINDIVIAIEKLRKKFPKVLYIDLDVHHGNGVQDAYNLSKSVFTLSIHKYEAGFYPGTGGVNDIGSLTGKGHCCNIPLHAGYNDQTMQYVFEKTFDAVYGHFGPDTIVLQCGADALAHDPHGGARLTAQGYAACLKHVLRRRLPTLLLGGGGYKHENAARLWSILTALVVNETLDENIPEHSHWPHYGPNYTLDIDPTLAKDNNNKDYLDYCIFTIKENLKTYLPIEEVAEPNPKRRRIDSISNEQVTSTSKINFRSKQSDCNNLDLDANSMEQDIYEFMD